MIHRELMHMVKTWSQAEERGDRSLHDALDKCLWMSFAERIHHRQEHNGVPNVVGEVNDSKVFWPIYSRNRSSAQ